MFSYVSSHNNYSARRIITNTPTKKVVYMTSIFKRGNIIDAFYIATFTFTDIRFGDHPLV
jgi:hypothetical protein